MNKLKINNHEISKDNPPFVIAEAGINHNGDIDKAKKMVKTAKNSGVDAIKFQTFKADEFITDSSLKITYQSQGSTITESQLELFKRCELSEIEFFEIKKTCDEENILFLSTPQNKSDLDVLLKIGITAIKVGSDDFTNIPLLKSYSKTNLPLLVSCGMADIQEVQETLDTIGSLDGYPTVLLLTTSEYPTIPENVNLLKLQTLSEKFPDLILGYSDHTQGSLASSLAVVLGARVLEKHFTLDNNLPGPDHWFSVNPSDLKKWNTSIQSAYKMLGTNEIKPTKNEEKMKILARRSIVSLCDIKKNQIFTENNLGLRRPGDGLPSSILESIFGKKATTDIPKFTKIRSSDYEE